MNNKYKCEVMEKNYCGGCVGLVENDWQGKYECKYYKEFYEKQNQKTQKENLFERR